MAGSRSQYKQQRNKENRETRPHAKHIRAPISDRKARIVLEQIKGKGVNQAAAILQFNPRYGAMLVGKVLKSAVANAEEIKHWTQKTYMYKKFLQTRALR